MKGPFGNRTLGGSLTHIPRVAYLALTGIILGVAVALLVGNTDLIAGHGGEDLAIQQRHTRDWLAGGSFYDVRQLNGPYVLQAGDSLYPPPMAIFMLPWLVLPDLLWWVVPALIVGYVIARHRPSPWAWPLLALCVASPRTLGLLIYGNPTLWVAAAVAAGTVWRYPAILAVLKPTLAPLALIGVRSRWWWVGMIVLVLISLAMLPDWAEYVTAMTNLTGQNGTYSLMDVPLAGIALVAWFARREPVDPRRVTLMDLRVDAVD